MELLRKVIEGKLTSIGLHFVRLQSFELRRGDKLLAAHVLLEGEDEVVEVNAGYTVEGDFIVVTSIETSRIWITHAARLVLEKSGNRFDLPGGMMGRMVKMLL
jgi:hypothetical protein